MGLDMYLDKYVAGKAEDEDESFGYWRKANQIHKWFVDNVQGGIDDCRPYPVSQSR